MRLFHFGWIWVIITKLIEILKDKLIFSVFMIAIIAIFNIINFFNIKYWIPNTQKEIEKIEYKRRFETDQSYFLEPPFFYLPSLKIPILKEGKLVAYLHLKVEMEASSHDFFSFSKIFLPLLVDRIFTDLYISFSSLWFVGVNPQLKVVKGRLFKVGESTLGYGAIRNIYIRQLMIERVFNNL